MIFHIQEAAAPEELQAIRALFTEYQQHLGLSLDFQGWPQELAALPGKYAPPRGALLLAMEGKEYAGCAGLRPLDDQGVCELKRLFVRPAFAGRGLGEALMRAVIDRARALGYERLRLDSLHRLTAAARLYARFPFYEIPAYNENPNHDIYYMEMRLGN